MKVLFFHVPKTGGVSIVSSIENRCDLESPGHISYDVALKRYGPKFMDSSFKFAFVRNPFDRFVSSYHYLIQQDKNHRYWKGDKHTSEKIKNIGDFLDFCKSFEDRKDINQYHHFKPMSNFLCKNDRIMVDFLGRYENIQQDFLKLTNMININNVFLEQKNASKHLDWWHYYSNNSYGVDSVRKFYEKDFEIFGYSLEGYLF